MEFGFTQEQTLLRQAAREFAEQVVAPEAERIDKAGEFPAAIFQEMAKLNLTGIIVPRKYGGVEMGHLARMFVLEEIGRISAAVSVLLQVHHLSMAPIIDLGTEEQKQRYLPALARGEKMIAISVTEPSGGSDILGMQTTARRDGDLYVLNGRKCFVSSSSVADYMVIVAKTGEGSKGLSAFIVDKGAEGLRVGREEHKLGLRGQGMGDLVLQNCRVSKDNLVGAEGDGLKVALRAIGEVGRAGMAGAALGIVGACLEASVKFANERILYGKPISQLQAIQLMIADMQADLEASRLLCYRAAWMKDQGQRCDAEMALAKYYTSEAAVRCAKRAIDIHGGYGILEEYAVQRYLRDAMTCLSAAGTSQVLQLIVARKALG